MILNDFKCTACEVVSEHRYNYKDQDILVCPECGDNDLKLLLSTPVISKLNTKQRVEDALKKRTVQDHKKHKAKRLERQKAKHSKLFDL
jgi:putative FmdB family regulatory protein